MSVNPGCVGATSNLDIGSVVPGGIAVSPDCTVTFGSSNDSSMLRISQADASGVAMWQTMGTSDLAYGGGDAISDLVNIGGNDIGYSAQRLSDGKLLIAGQGGATDDVVVVRFNADGSNDLTYGGGDAISDVVNVGGVENPTASILQSDGKLLVTGKGGPGDDFVVVRFNPDGSKDLTYGGGDAISDLVNLGGVDRSFSPQLQADGKLLLAGQGGLGDDFAVVRYNTDGSLDLTYGGGDGISDLVNDGGTEVGYSANLLTSGKLVVAGRSGSKMVAVRYNADGSLDLSYGGGDGISDLVAVGVSGRAYSSYILNSDMLLMAGQGNGDFVAVRLDSNGSLDTSYGGGDGISDYIDFGGTEIARSSLLLPDGRLAISGQAGPGGDIGIGMLRANGSKDLSYGGGDATSDLVNTGGAADTAYSLVLGTDGKLIGAGTGGAGSDFGAAQFDAVGIAQYSPGVADWETVGSRNAFGACLKSAGGGASSQWTPNASCPTSGGSADGPWWNAVPATPVKVAYATSAGTTFTATIRFAFRAKVDQAAGAYIAPVVFEVVAPNV